MSVDFIKKVYSGLVACDRVRSAGVGKISKDGIVYYVSGVGILQAPPVNEELVMPTGVFHTWEQGVPLPQISASTDLSPAAMLLTDSVAVPDVPDYASVMMLPVTKIGDPAFWFVVPGDDASRFKVVCKAAMGDSEFMRGLTMRFYAFPKAFLRVVDRCGGLDNTAIQLRLKNSPGVKHLVLYLVADEASAFIALSAPSISQACEIVDGDVTYKLDAWNSEEFCFKSIKEKKGKMAKLQNPIKHAEDEARLKEAEKLADEMVERGEIETDTIVEDTIQESEVSSVVEAKVSGVAESEVSSVVEPDAVVVAQPDIDSSADATDPAQADQSSTARARTRRARQVSTVGFDFSKVLEYTGSQVDITNVSSDKITEELRNLRDLQIGCARRMYNLAAAALDQYKEDFCKYQEVKRFFR